MNVVKDVYEKYGINLYLKGIRMIKRVSFTAAILFVLVTLPSVMFGQCRCIPGQKCWPSKHVWQQLGASLHGNLVQPKSPLADCRQDDKSQACKKALQKIKNPFYLQTQPGFSENQGWLGAWKAQPSAYAVEAQDSHDVIKAVNFAREHHLRLAIKGAGHDYLGRSSAPNSLLIWTHNMRNIHYHTSFVPEGCHHKMGPAVTVGAGVRWGGVYQNVTTKHHHYVQGGGCTTVGAAGGFTQGGGFGSFSKAYGTGAGGMLQAKVVLANGKLVTANACQHQDLFWALRGGGGGTYGVVTQMTLRVHPLPKHAGLLTGEIKANSNQAYKQLIQHFLKFYIHNLNNPHWGEQFHFKPDNTLSLAMVSQNLTVKQVDKVWQPFFSWVKTHKKAYHMKKEYMAIPPKKLWSYSYWEKNRPGFVTKNTGKNARPGEFWWSSNSGEVYHYWYTYQSWWLPMRLFKEKQLAKTAQIFYQASRHNTVAVHINKGLAGASPQAVKLAKQTSTNPSVFHAAALVLMSAGTNDHKIFAKDKDSSKVKHQVKQINQAMQLFKDAAPQAGSYVNEADYFEPNWQQVFWGPHYKRLRKIKHQYDPAGLFYCHHCVGSEDWSNHGMCTKKTEGKMQTS